MNDFERVKQILDDSIGGANIGAHRAFWRDSTRDEFVAMQVFGQELLIVGDGDGSNLVKALRGESPFGADLPTPPPGAIFNRMPSGRPPVPDPDIDFIRDWIDSGCPDDDGAKSIEPFTHLAVWRLFDDWAMFNATPETSAAIGTFFGVTENWRDFARDATNESQWQTAIEVPSVKAAIELLAERQFETFSGHFGEPMQIDALLDSFERFGDNSLPDDIDRPDDVRHNMNGAGMWFMWCAFADASIRLNIRQEFWFMMSRGILIGLLNDGLVRGRFTVNGFERSVAGKEAIRQHVRSLADTDLQQQLRNRFVESGLG